MNKQSYTYQSSIMLTNLTEKFLLDFSTIMNHVEKKLYVKLITKNFNENETKRAFIKEYGISARQYNSIYKLLVGKINSVKALLIYEIDKLQDNIKSIETYINKLEKKDGLTQQQKNTLHQKKRRLAIQRNKLIKLENDKKNNIARICFGSKKLFKKQFNLEANGYTNHEAWLKDWQNSRISEFTLIGSKDESSGNQSCIATINTDETLNLRLKVPPSLEKEHGKFMLLENIKLHYGKESILAALKENLLRRELSLKTFKAVHGDKYKQHGQAITYKFKWDYSKNRWYVYLTLDVEGKEPQVYEGIGVIGVDINVNHLAVSETDAYGNPVNNFSIPLTTYGKSKEQAKALIGDACKKVVDYSLDKGKPIVAEKLDFKKKKTTLRQTSNRYARMLSCFAYSLIIAMLVSRAFRYGSKVHFVNPAFSSLIGRVKFAKRYGLSIHHSAALVLARRYNNFSERLPKVFSEIPDGHGGHVALSATVSMQGKHLWSLWGVVFGKMKAVLAEQYKVRRQSLCSA